MKNTNKRTRVVSFLCALIMFFSVWGPNKAFAGSITISQGITSNYTAAAAGETITVTLKNAYTSVVLQGKPSWITSTKSGSKFTLKVAAIPAGTETRQSDVVFRDGTKVWTLRVKQNCSHTYVTYSNSERYCSKCKLPDYNYYMNSSTHFISTSGSDENGQSKGGAAGDSTGKEWKMTTSFDSINLGYIPQKEKRYVKINVYRYNSSVGQKLARLSIAAALNNNIGYDQSNNTSYWKELQAVGYDPRKINSNHKCEQDCAAGVSSNVKAVGCLLGIAKLKNMPISYTGDLGTALMNAGFSRIMKDRTSLSESEINSLRAGDIVIVRYERYVYIEEEKVYKWVGKGHAVVNVTGN